MFAWSKRFPAVKRLCNTLYLCFCGYRPILAPLLVVESATYGQTAIGIDERLQIVQKELSELLSLQNHKDKGMLLSREEMKRLVRLRPLIAEIE